MAWLFDVYSISPANYISTLAPPPPSFPPSFFCFSTRISILFLRFLPELVKGKWVSYSLGQRKKKLVIFSLLCSSVTVCRKDKAIWERCMCIWRFSARKLTRTVRSVFYESRAVFCARISAYVTPACNFLQKI